MQKYNSLIKTDILIHPMGIMRQHSLNNQKLRLI